MASSFKRILEEVMEEEPMEIERLKIETGVPNTYLNFEFVKDVNGDYQLKNPNWRNYCIVSHAPRHLPDTPDRTLIFVSPKYLSETLKELYNELLGHQMSLESMN